MKLRRSLAVRSLLFVLAATGLLLSGSIGAVQGALQSPPEIVKIEFPPVIPLTGGKGKLHFRDPDGDIVFVKFVPVESVSGEVLWGQDPQVQGQTEGTFEFQIFCLPIPSMGALKVYLRDATGAWSRPAFFTYLCDSPPASNYDHEQATVRETRWRVPLNFFFLTDGATELSENAQFKDEQAPLGEPDPVVRRLIEQVIWPDINGIFDQCALAFELGIVKVLRPAKVRLPSGEALDRLFNDASIGRKILDFREAAAKLDQAIPALHRVLQAEGLEILRDARNLFVVGHEGGPEVRNNSFVRQRGGGLLPGRVAIASWAGFWAEGEQFYKPQQTVRLIAHELGHNFGLPHFHQGVNVMGYLTPAGVELLKEQCEIVQKNIELPDFPKGA